MKSLKMFKFLKNLQNKSRHFFFNSLHSFFGLLLSFDKPLCSAHSNRFLINPISFQIKPLLQQDARNQTLEMFSFRIIVLCLCSFVFTDCFSTFFQMQNESMKVVTDETTTKNMETPEISIDKNSKESDEGKESEESESGFMYLETTTVIDESFTVSDDLATEKNLEELVAEDDSSEFKLEIIDIEESSGAFKGSDCGDDEDNCKE